MAKYYLNHGDRELEAEVEDADGASSRVRLDDEWVSCSLRRLGGTPRYVLVLPDRAVEVVAVERTRGLRIQVDGLTYDIETVRPARGRRGSKDRQSDEVVDGRWHLQSPLTGSVVEVRVAVGDVVEAGAVVMVIEAMKMQNELRARIAGTVVALHAAVGERVEGGQQLLEIEAAASAEAPP